MPALDPRCDGALWPSSFTGDIIDFAANPIQSIDRLAVVAGRWPMLLLIQQSGRQHFLGDISNRAPPDAENQRDAAPVSTASGERQN